MADTLEDAISTSVPLSSDEVTISTTTAVPVEEAEIVPGTTPDLIIGVSSDILSTTESARIDIVQNGRVLLQVPGTINETNVSYHFKQEETYLMKKGTIKVQVHGGYTHDDHHDAWKTNVFEIAIDESLTDTLIE